MCTGKVIRLPGLETLGEFKDICTGAWVTPTSVDADREKVIPGKGSSCNPEAQCERRDARDARERRRGQRG